MECEVKEILENVCMQVGMIQNRGRNQRHRREGDNCNNNILEKARNKIPSTSGRFVSFRWEQGCFTLSNRMKGREYEYRCRKPRSLADGKDEDVPI